MTLWRGRIFGLVLFKRSGACWAETVGSRSRREIPGPVQKKEAGPGTGIKEGKIGFRSS